MMQVFPIVLVAIVLASDAGVHMQPEWLEPTPMQVVIAVWLPVALIVAAAWMLVTYCRRRVERGGSPMLLMIAERFIAGSRWLLLIHHAVSIFVLGWLSVVREGIGDLILIDEFIALLPPLIGLIGLWWAYYPIEVRIREAMLVRRLDLGKPIHPMPTRLRYVFEQLRIGLLLLLLPLLVIIALAQTIGIAADRLVGPELAQRISQLSVLIAAAMVFVFAPLLARILLNVQRVPDGALRDELLEVCRRHNVRVRDVLLWHTGGSMVNAAVMGLVAPLRYVLITDGLLESMTPEQVRAVMAHEVGHVRRHHMPWMILTLLAIMVISVVVIEGTLLLYIMLGLPTAPGTGQWLAGPALFAQLAIVLFIFGWVSRRFERQADTFAVQHLSGLGWPGRKEMNPDGVVVPHAVYAMNSALETIAQLNAVDRNRPSWRHGSIAWRQSYLMQLIGQRMDVMAIDRIVRRIKAASAGVLIGGAAGWFVLQAILPEQAPQPEERRERPAGLLYVFVPQHVGSSPGLPTCGTPLAIAGDAAIIWRLQSLRSQTNFREQHVEQRP